MNVDSITLDTIVASCMTWHIKRSFTIIRVAYSLGYKNGATYTECEAPN